MAQFDWKITQIEAQKVEQPKVVPLPWKPAEEAT